MPYPSLSFPHELPAVLRRELEQFISLLSAFLSLEHTETGAHGDVTAESAIVDGNLTVTTGTVQLKSRLAPAQITANTNDYAISTASRAFIFSDAARDITGIKAGLDGQILRVTNYGGFTITLKNNNAASAVGNRLACANSADVLIRANGTAVMLYDTASLFWWVEGV